MRPLLIALAALAGCATPAGIPSAPPDVPAVADSSVTDVGPSDTIDVLDPIDSEDAADVAPVDGDDDVEVIEEDVIEPPDVPDEIPCVPDCTDKVCGDDGCGGSCGKCAGVTSCVAGACACQPHCAGKACGEDKCGGSCGECGAGQACDGGQCVCVPACDGKECGDDGCGGDCGACKPLFACDKGFCVCPQQCDGKLCGDDGCGGDCGPCAVGDVCTGAFACTSPCADQCVGKQCGLGTCGKSCGTCPPNEVCKQGQCKDPNTCVPSCEGKTCGSNGCFGSCGNCGGGTYCLEGQCVDTCLPSCTGKACGDDGCGGSCGPCAVGIPCTANGVCGNACTSCLYQDACFAQSLEAGDLGGWVTSGKSEVVESLGAAVPTDGAFMLSLATGAVVEGDISSDASFPTCLPSGTYQLRFDLKLYSEQFVEWCGSASQDRFTVEIAGAAGVTTLVDYAIDDLCPKVACAGCGEHFLGLSMADVHFDQGVSGDVWMTPWAAVSVFFEAAGGVPFQLRFAAEDAGDAQLDTVALVDRIELLPCVKQCAGKTCGDDGCGGSCGTCLGGGACMSGVCCAPSCANKTCGSDGCGGSCGGCNDKDPCTTDACGPNGYCVFSAGDALCCDSDIDCDDGQACTKDGCDLAAGVCQFVPLGGLECCLQDADCDDGDDICTPIDDCTEGLCTHSVGAACCNGAPFAFDFTDDTQGFTVANDKAGKGWSWTTLGTHNETPGAFYYGDPAAGTYHFGGAATAGSVTSASLTLPPGQVTLGFAAYADVEWGFADSLQVIVRAEGGAPVVVWTKSDPAFAMLQWTTYSVDVTAFAGKAVTLEWRFDTVDAFDNKTEGVYVDDVAVTSTCQPKDCIVDAACDDGIPATTESCVGGTCLYGTP